MLINVKHKLQAISSMKDEVQNGIYKKSDGDQSVYTLTDNGLPV